MTYIVTYDKLNECVNVYGNDGLQTTVTSMPKENGGMISVYVEDGKSVFVYRDRLDEIHAAVQKTNGSLSSHIKKKWKFK